MRPTASAISSGEVPMFIRANPRPWVPNPGPELSATRPPVQELGRGIVAQAQLPAVQPGQEARLRRHVPHGGQLVGEQPGQQRRGSRRAAPAARPARAATPSNAATDPSTPTWPGSSASQRSSSTLSVSGEPEIATPHLSPGMFHAFDAEVNAKERSAMLVIHGQERHVLRTGQRERRVDLVDQQRDPVPLADVGHRGQLLAGPDPAGRVVRAGEQAGADAVAGQGPVERLGIEVVAAVVVTPQRRLDHPAPGEPQPVEERLVDRRGDHDRRIRAA